MLALLLAVAQAFVMLETDPDAEPGHLIFDKYIAPDEDQMMTPQSMYARVTRNNGYNTHHERWVPGAGTRCNIYVKHGSLPVLGIWGGTESPWSWQTPYGRADYAHRNAVDNDEVWTDGVLFRPPYGQNSQYNYPVNTNGVTYIWSNCDDALLIDWLELRDTQGNTRRWGSNDHTGWCLSNDPRDQDWFNSVARMLFTNYHSHNRFGDIVVQDSCYAWMRLDRDGLHGYTGWNGMRSTPEYVSETEMRELSDRTIQEEFPGVPALWRRVFAGENFEGPTPEPVQTHAGSDDDMGYGEEYDMGRRMLEDEPPKKDKRTLQMEYLACEEDPERTEEDCMPIVEEIFVYIKEHDDEFERLQSSVWDKMENFEEEENSDGGDAATAGDVTQREDGHSSKEAVANSGIRRRLQHMLPSLP